MKLTRRQMLLSTLAAPAILGTGLCGCHTTPITGRRQLMLLPESQEISLGVTAYSETLSSEPLSSNSRLVEMVKRVGTRIAAVSQRNDFAWEFNLIADPTQNAFCLPGGKVAFYEGILPVCADEAGLAVVMAHEVAHALARHGGERMSQNIGVNGARLALEKVASTRFPERQDLLLQAYGVATEYGVLLPYNRRQESEADHIGLMLMAQAGYDPTAAPEFWTRFGQLKAAGDQATQTSEWLSTHPSDDRRSTDLAGLMSQAIPLYENAAAKFGRGESLYG